MYKMIKLIQKTTNTAHKTIVLCRTYIFSPIKSIYRSFIYNLIKNLQLVISLWYIRKIKIKTTRFITRILSLRLNYFVHFSISFKREFQKIPMHQNYLLSRSWHLEGFRPSTWRRGVEGVGWRLVENSKLLL